MPNYMLLFYASPTGDDEVAERDADLPAWVELMNSLEDEGVLVSKGRLRGTDSATTVRIRDGETEIVDGPFAVTKEILGGYFLLECSDLDEALRHAERVPLARYGSVEVRPVMEPSEALAQTRTAEGT
jgi:hypothetical protein